MSKYDYEYSLIGTINHSLVEGTGTGIINTDTGEFIADINFSRVPMHWDPAFNFLMTDTTQPYTVKEVTGISLRSIAPDGYSVNWRGAYLYDASNRIVGHVTASSKTEITGNKIRMHSEIHDSWVYLAPDEKIVEIETPYRAMLMDMEHVNIMTAAYCVKTDKGNMYWGWTTYPYIVPTNKTIHHNQIITIEHVELSQKRQLNGQSQISYNRVSRIDKF
ncbi:hypothetical protein [Enterobacter cloacae complex sp. SHL009]|uniref:hypothetical protein n=1 Tax=Enterobacter cloacae complex sp. SHL009 TaxID=3412392 RepID=UPI003B9DA9F2